LEGDGSAIFLRRRGVFFLRLLGDGVQEAAVVRKGKVSKSGRASALKGYKEIFKCFLAVTG
jgi:hypothetical protein